MRGNSFRFLYLPALFIFLISVRNSGAAGKPELRFLDQTDLPNAGIRLKLMQKASETPLPPPGIATYTMRDSDGKESRVEMQSPYELWLHDQHIGIWRDPSGNTLTLAAIKYPMPTGFKYMHATREDYRREADRLMSAQEEWTASGLTDWVQAYLKDKDITAEAAKQKPFKFSHLVKFRCKNDSAHRFAIAFRFNKSASGQQTAADNWFFLYLEINREIKPDIALNAIGKELIASIGVPPMSATHRVAKSKEFGSKNTSALGGGAKSEEFVRSREIVKNSISNLKDWWFIETDNYIILSDLKTSYKATINDLQQNIEYLRSAYEKLLPPVKPFTAVSVIRVPGTPEEYISYVGQEYGWSGGIWIPSRRELVIRAVDAGPSKFKKEQMLSTSYHEGFHQYLFYALDQGNAHPWFNEGHASFFEAVNMNNARFQIDEHEYFARDIDKMIQDKALDIKKLTGITHSEFYQGSDLTRSRNYASAWLLVYYLRKFAAFDRASPYSQIIPVYYSELSKNGNPETANTRAFASINQEKLQEDIVKFWTTKNLRVKARYNRLFPGFKPASSRR